MDLLSQADRIPPCLCRVLARKCNGRRGMSHRELAEASGLSKSYVAELSRKTSWRGQRIEVIVNFSRACGVDLMKPCSVTEYLKKCKRIYIANAPKAQKKMYLRIFRLVGRASA